MKNPADFRFFLVENVGLVVTPGPNNTYNVLGPPIVPSNFTGRELAIKDGTVYSSRVTQSASAKGGYLAFAAGLSASEAVNLQIVDVTRVDVPWVQFPADKIRAAAAQANPSGLKRLWIQSLILSRVISSSSSTISCDASGAGPAFQFESKCYNENDGVTNDFAVAAVFLDIDKWVKDNPVGIPVVPTKPPPELMFANPHSSIATQIDAVMQLLGRKLPSTNGKPELPAYISVQPPGGELKDFRRQ